MDPEIVGWFYLAVSVVGLVWAIMLLCIPFMVYSIMQRMKNMEGQLADIITLLKPLGSKK